MKVPLSQLSSHLERGLRPIYLVAADEPLQVQEATDEIRRAAMSQGFEERNLHFVERGFRWESVLGEADALSLFAARRIVELRMATPRPGDAGAKAIRALAEEQDPDRLVIISIQSRLDANVAKSVWARTVEREGVLVEIRPVSRNDLPAFVTRRAKLHGLSIARDAAELLAERTEGNLLAADQELIKLSLILDDGHVDADAVLEAVTSSARFDVFRLSDAVIAGDLGRAMTVLEGLKTEGIAAPLVLWALVREISVLAQIRHGMAHGENANALMSRMRIWQSRQSLMRRALDRYSLADLTRLLLHAGRVDRAIKGLDRLPVWEAIGGLVLDALAPESRRLSA